MADEISLRRVLGILQVAQSVFCIDVPNHLPEPRRVVIVALRFVRRNSKPLFTLATDPFSRDIQPHDRGYLNGSRRLSDAVCEVQATDSEAGRHRREERHIRTTLEEGVRGLVHELKFFRVRTPLLEQRAVHLNGKSLSLIFAIIEEKAFPALCQPR
jgi:hypothetical protein